MHVYRSSWSSQFAKRSRETAGPRTAISGFLPSSAFLLDGSVIGSFELRADSSGRLARSLTRVIRETPSRGPPATAPSEGEVFARARVVLDGHPTEPERTPSRDACQVGRSQG